MAHSAQHLERLARELAELAPDERARVVADAARRDHPQPQKTKFAVPKLAGGTAWIGGDLRREELYGDDGR